MPRALARRNDGCYECCKRRLRCDKTEPECLKCQKKGIQCSGQGLRCRFSSHMSVVSSSSVSSGGRAKAKTRLASPKSPSSLATTPAPSSSPAPSLSPGIMLSPMSVSSFLTPGNDSLMGLGTIDQLPWDMGWVEDDGAAVSASPASAVSAVSPSPCQSVVASSPRNYQEEAAERLLTLIRTGGTPLRAAINEPLHPQARMLFNHFCDHVAPIMVVLDFAGNGYRDIILPLAMQDDVLRRAVSVVAAFHLAQKAPQLRQSALAGHQAIVEKLRRDSLRLRPDQLFTPYTWATIVVLLVGETITGADNYVYLLEMLTCLRQSPEAIEALPPALREFFVQQGKMFELFGFPLADEAKGLDVMRRSPDAYMDFMSYPTLPATSEHQGNMQIMRGAIRDACELYQHRALSSPSTEDSILSVEWLRQRVLPVRATTPGAHALVWTYFVAAADSALPEHREFFSTRLKELHQFTGFGSIPAALKALETIWAMQGVKRWTEIMSKDMPVLVM